MAMIYPSKRYLVPLFQGTLRVEVQISNFVWMKTTYKNPLKPPMKPPMKLFKEGSAWLSRLLSSHQCPRQLSEAPRQNLQWIPWTWTFLEKFKKQINMHTDLIFVWELVWLFLADILFLESFWAAPPSPASLLRSPGTESKMLNWEVSGAIRPQRKATSEERETWRRVQNQRTFTHKRGLSGLTLFSISKLSGF